LACMAITATHERAVEGVDLGLVTNLLFAYELQRRLTGRKTVAVAAHPGGAISELSRYQPRFVKVVFNMLSQDAAMGALPTLRAATDPGVVGGQYYGPGGFLQMRGFPELCESHARSHDLAVARRLWSVSEKLTGVTFPI
jgi:hypothetical protein